MIDNETLFLVVDTETTNSIDDPFAYDVGFAVVKATGEVLEAHSYVVTDIFLDKDLMDLPILLTKSPSIGKILRAASISCGGSRPSSLSCAM